MFFHLYPVSYTTFSSPHFADLVMPASFSKDPLKKFLMVKIKPEL